MWPFMFRRRRRRRIPVRRTLAEGDALFHLGARLILRIADSCEQPHGCEIRDTFLEVNLHDAATSIVQRSEEAQLELQLWRKKEARRVFRERTDHWQQKLGVTCRSLKFTNAQRQWGSCSGRDDVRINWRLITSSLELLDYVIVHELCHITHKNHGPRFWRMVASVMPDWKARRKRLRTIDPGVGQV